MDESDTDIYPESIKLREFEDSDSLRNDIFEGIKEEFSRSFPREYGNSRVTLDNLNYSDKEHFTFKEQKDALLKNKYLHRRLKGDYKLYDKTTNELLDEKLNTTVMRVPYLSNRGTFIHNGNEYSLINQSRLDSGIYTRKKNNGDIEAHVNPERGHGKSFRIRLEPSSGLFKMDIGQSSLHLYSLLRDLGTSDEQLSDSWGQSILDTNRQKYDSRVFNKTYERLVPSYIQDKNHTHEEKKNLILDYLGKTKTKASVLEKTLPQLFV